MLSRLVTAADKKRVLAASFVGTTIEWFGLGDAKGYSDDRFRKDVAWMVDVVGRAGVTEWTFQAPGRASGLIGARRAIEILLEDQLLANQAITHMLKTTSRQTMRL